jgi:phosphoglycerol transferase MdoB-like AlkP superfamily enzyme
VAVGLYDRLFFNIEEGEEKLKTIGKKREGNVEFQLSRLFSAVIFVKPFSTSRRNQLSYSATSWVLARDTGVPVTGFSANSVIGITDVALILFVIMIFFTIQLSSYSWMMRIIY